MRRAREPEDAGRVEALEPLIHARRYQEALDGALAALADELEPRTRAVAHSLAGQALHHLRRDEEAVDHLRTAVGLADELDDLWLAAEAMDWQALASFASDGQQALELEEDALARYRRLGSRRPEVEARMLEHLGTLFTRRRAYGRAQEAYEEALAVMGTVRDLQDMARINHGMAGCLRAAGDVRRAIERMERAVALYSIESELRPDQSCVPLASAYNDLAMLLLERGEWDRAGELLTTALGIFVQADLVLWQGYILHSLGDLRRRQGRLTEAFALTREALALAQRLDQPLLMAGCLQQMGELHEDQGEPGLADEAFEQGIALLEQTSLTDRLADFRRAYAVMLEARGATEAEAGAAG
ncbi:MAG TPA: tetratricopeptide repeat protein [Candidatus Dormibacteraeota bacterium]|nr:tetratricopeptide repeat protein [Candidatus Dormibacteraeota bacterium]